MMSASKSLQISRADVNSMSSLQKCVISNTRYLASYNWIEAAHPTIAVPGSPAKWTGIGLRTRIPADKGMFLIAQNNARHPDSPLESLFRAVQIESPGFDMSKVDLISDRNNIRKILGFINPSTRQGACKAFMITAQKVGNTVLLQREGELQEFIAPHEYRGHGSEFEKASTAEQIEGSTGHHRIIAYRFGGLELAIRYKLDGFVAKPHTRAEPAANEDIVSSTKDHAIATAAAAQEPVKFKSKLAILRSGSRIPQACTLEIKTRVAHRPIGIDESGAQLWISQTPKLVRAYHVKGCFRAHRVEDVEAEIREWESKQQRSLQQLAALLTRIIGFVQVHDQATIHYRVESDDLLLEVAPSKTVLPIDICQSWVREPDNSKSHLAAEVEKGGLEPEDLLLSYTDVKEDSV